MIRTCILLSLAIASAYGQLSPPAQGEAAPEPYSYGYEAENHAAAESRDPNGRVTGYYTLSDADGRARRVEYVADESGFHAKVQTNEVGTKSENSADVEVLASPPTREQYVYQQTPVVPAPVVQQQRTVSSAVQQAGPARAQQGYAQYGYYPGSYGYNSGYNSYAGPSYAYASPAYGYTNGYGAGYGAGYSGYGAGNSGYGNAGYASGVYSNYNNHLPSSYYRSVSGVQPSSYSSVSGVQPSSYSSVSGVQPSSYSSGGVVSRYTVSNPVVGAVGSTGSSYRTVGVPVNVGYQSAVVNPQRVAYTSPVGSSNYIVLKKRESSEANAQTEAKTEKQ